MRSISFCGLLFCLITTGCASARHIHLPDGTRGSMVSCSGAEHDWGDCMNQAHALCSGRYRIVERYDERAGVMRKQAEGGGQQWSSTKDRKMLVSCEG